MYLIFSEHQRKIAMACRVRDQSEHGDRERRGGVRRGLGRGQEQRVQPAALWHDWLPGEHHHCPGLPTPPGSPRASQGLPSPHLCSFYVAFYVTSNCVTRNFPTLEYQCICALINTCQHYRSSMGSMSQRYPLTRLQRVRKFTRGQSQDGPELSSTPRWRFNLDSSWTWS